MFCYSVLSQQPKAVNTRAMEMEPDCTEGDQRVREECSDCRTPGNPTFKAGHRKEIQRRCKQVTRETERKQGMCQKGRFEEDRGAV